MADPFIPKFVDLVRNYTTTTGTGDFTLGPAVNGFTGLAGALTPGDRFYYSCIGVDKPAEREVGRGTLTADGKVVREPITGPKTNFSTGNKAIALVAAAEWHASVKPAIDAAASAVTAVQGAVDTLSGDVGDVVIQVAGIDNQLGGAVQDIAALAADIAAIGSAGAKSVATRAELAGLSAVSSNLAVLREAGREGVFVWSAANLSAMVTLDPQQGVYIPPASDITGASGAWVRRYSGPADARWFGAVGDGVTDDAVALQAWLDFGGPLWLPKTDSTHWFRSSATLYVRKLVHVSGANIGADPTAAGVGSGYQYYLGSRIVFDAGVAGLNVQPSTTITDVATAVAAGAARNTQPGAFGSVFEHIGLVGGGGAAATGFYTRTRFYATNVRVMQFSGKGWDLSASSATADGNSEYGNLNNSFMLNCTAEQCGSHGLHLRGTDANAVLVTNFYGIINGGWGLMCEALIGGVFVQPNLSTNALGAISASASSQTNLFLRPYVETGNGSNCDISSSNVFVGSDISTLNVAGKYPTQVGGKKVQTGTLIADSENSNSNKIQINDLGVAKSYINTSLNVDFALKNADSSVAFRVYDATRLRRFEILGGLWNSVATSRVSTTTGMQAFYDAANGARFEGGGTTYDVSFGNKNGTTALRVPTGTTNVEVVGTVTSVSATGGIGYGTGAGGAVTQATSKATGVTLNKATGAITMNGAALAAAAVVEFTVTNSAVAATDTINLNLASGAAASTAYRYRISAVAAGSFKICVENRSAGSLSEALVLNFAVVKAVAA